jgi:hypothetical protein
MIERTRVRTQRAEWGNLAPLASYGTYLQTLRDQVTDVRMLLDLAASAPSTTTSVSKILMIERMLDRYVRRPAIVDAGVSEVGSFLRHIAHYVWTLSRTGKRRGDTVDRRLHGAARALHDMATETSRLIRCPVV